LEKELLDEHPQPIPLNDPIQLPPDIASALAADPSQLEAAKTALLQRLSIIQGPPGSGNE
jgi:hypothetical protein